MIEGYGLTEGKPVVTLMPRRVRHKLGTVGLPLPGFEVRIEGGELLVRSAGVMRSYDGMPEETAEYLSAGGWLRTGDLAEIVDTRLHRLRRPQ